jgi:hypothetical protein
MSQNKFLDTLLISVNYNILQKMMLKNVLDYLVETLVETGVKHTQLLEIV